MIDQMFGIGLPTTCGYSIIYGPKTTVHHIQGSYIQMFFAVHIQSEMIHHAFSWCFPHATAVPLGHTIDHRILIYNKNYVHHKS